jgi:hypothetical protein
LTEVRHAVIASFLFSFPLPLLFAEVRSVTGHKKPSLMSTLQYRSNASAPSSVSSVSTTNSAASSRSNPSRLSTRSNSSTSFKAGLGIPSGSSHSVNSTRSTNRFNARSNSTNSIQGLRGRMSSSFEQPQTLAMLLRTQYDKVTSGFSSLSGSPPELWKAYLLKFLDSYAYFSFSLVFTLFLSSEFGMSDVQAGSIYGAWGALITIFGLFTGTVIDNLGVATCLKIGFVLSFVTRTTLFICTSKHVLLLCLLVFLPLANCLGELVFLCFSFQSHFLIISSITDFDTIYLRVNPYAQASQF